MISKNLFPDTDLLMGVMGLKNARVEATDFDKNEIM
jgi:hypothetical protein